MGILYFSLAGALTFVLASAISTLLAAPGSGAVSFFPILCLLSLVAAALLVVGHGPVLALGRRDARPRRSVVLGIACAAIFLAILAVAAASGANPAKSWPILLALPALGAIAGTLQPRRQG